MSRYSVLAILAMCFGPAALANLNPQEVANFQRITRGGTLVCRNRQAPDTAVTLKKFGNFNLSLKNGQFQIVGNAGDSEVEDIHVGDFIFVEIGGSTGSTQFALVLRDLNLGGAVAGTLSEYDDDESTMTKQVFCTVR
jgi:hypothetical protein